MKLLSGLNEGDLLQVLHFDELFEKIYMHDESTNTMRRVRADEVDWGIISLLGLLFLVSKSYAATLTSWAESYNGNGR
jgi:hypothetical protein